MMGDVQDVIKPLGSIFLIVLCRALLGDSARRGYCSKFWSLGSPRPQQIMYLASCAAATTLLVAEAFLSEPSAGAAPGTHENEVSTRDVRASLALWSQDVFPFLASLQPCKRIPDDPEHRFCGLSPVACDLATGIEQPDPNAPA